MKKFIKDNWFKILIAICLIIISFSVAYYFIYLLPKQQELKLELESQKEKVEQKVVAEQLLQDRMVECVKIARQMHNDDVKNNPTLNYGDSEYFYNRDKEICLYYGMYVDFKDVSALYLEKFIMDVYTNEVLAFYAQISGKTFIGDIDNFNAKYDNLFNKY